VLNSLRVAEPCAAQLTVEGASYNTNTQAAYMSSSDWGME
jgi:hypothetical protein